MKELSDKPLIMAEGPITDKIVCLYERPDNFEEFMRIDSLQLPVKVLWCEKLSRLDMIFLDTLSRSDETFLKFYQEYT